jgi:hypothetical protein
MSGNSIEGIPGIESFALVKREAKKGDKKSKKSKKCKKGKKGKKGRKCGCGYAGKICIATKTKPLDELPTKTIDEAFPPPPTKTIDESPPPPTETIDESPPPPTETTDELPPPPTKTTDEAPPTTVTPLSTIAAPFPTPLPTSTSEPSLPELSPKPVCSVKAPDASSCFVEYQSKVYDLTKYLPIHSGKAEPIQGFCGQSGTAFATAFVLKHSTKPFPPSEALLICSL